jgi:hypothetical protein
MSGTIIDFDDARMRRAANSFDVDIDHIDEINELEKAALRFFEAITTSLEHGAQPDQVDRLVDRMDLMLSAIQCLKLQKTGRLHS